MRRSLRETGTIAIETFGVCVVWVGESGELDAQEVHMFFLLSISKVQGLARAHLKHHTKPPGKHAYIITDEYMYGGDCTIRA